MPALADMGQHQLQWHMHTQHSLLYVVQGADNSALVHGGYPLRLSRSDNTAS